MCSTGLPWKNGEHPGDPLRIACSSEFIFRELRMRHPDDHARVICTLYNTKVIPHMDILGKKYRPRASVPLVPVPEPEPAVRDLLAMAPDVNSSDTD